MRQLIVGGKRHRGDIVDALLESDEELVETPEGQVFDTFHQQLIQAPDLERMKRRLRSILQHSVTETALERKQKTELARLVPRLVEESARGIQARAREALGLELYREGKVSLRRMGELVGVGGDY